MFSKALIVAALCAQALAVYITNPVASTTLSGGKETTITWEQAKDGPTLKDFGPCKISVYVGNALQQTSLQLISDNVDVSKESSVKFTLDPTIGPNSKEYFIRVESLSFKDPKQPQYPALAFSAKFTADNMSGTFTPAIQSQIAGQSTAPLAGPTSTGTSTSATTKANSASTTASNTSTAKTSATSAPAGNGALSNKAGWAGVAIAAVVGITMF
jgi:hypothetical protein